MSLKYRIVPFQKRINRKAEIRGKEVMGKEKFLAFGFLNIFIGRLKNER